MHSGSRGPSEFFFFFFFPSGMPPKCLDQDCEGIEDAVQGLGMAMSTVVSETERGNCCLTAKFFTNGDISARCFTSIYGKKKLGSSGEQRK